MKKKTLIVILIVFFNQLYSQEKTPIISAIDTAGNVIEYAQFYFSNDSTTLTEKELFNLLNSSWRNSKPCSIVGAPATPEGTVNLNNNYRFVHVMRFGYQSNYILIDSIKENKEIVLKEKVYEFPKLLIYRDTVIIDWNNFNADLNNSFIEYYFKTDTIKTEEGKETILVHDSPEFIEDSTYGWFTSPHAYPINGISDFLYRLEEKLISTNFKEIIIHFVVLKSDIIVVTKIDGISSRESLLVKELFENIASWKSAYRYSKKIELKYKLVIIKENKRFT